MSDKRTAIEKRADKEIMLNIYLAPFFDAWVIMMCLGGLSHQQHLPRLALSYWSCLLIIVISIAILPQNWRTSAYLKQIMLKVGKL